MTFSAANLRRAIADYERFWRTTKDPVNPDKLRFILGLLGRFIALIQSVVRRKQSSRSFSSKYMHFHCRAVLITDTYAVGACRKMVRLHTSFLLFDLPAEANEYYARYLLLFRPLHVIARDAGLKPTVKQLDYYLWSTRGAVA